MGFIVDRGIDAMVTSPVVGETNANQLSEERAFAGDSTDAGGVAMGSRPTEVPSAVEHVAIEHAAEDGAPDVTQDISEIQTPTGGQLVAHVGLEAAVNIDNATNSLSDNDIS